MIRGENARNEIDSTSSRHQSYASMFSLISVRSVTIRIGLNVRDSKMMKSNGVPQMPERMDASWEYVCILRSYGVR